MTKITAIDAHVHLWDPMRDDDILICKNKPELADYASPAELKLHLEQGDFQGAIAIQSAPDHDHSDWLIAHAATIPGVVGVVAWIDPSAPDAKEKADALIATPLVCGVRLMINRISNPSDLLLPHSLAVMSLLSANDITIELLAPPSLLNVVVQLTGAFEGKMVLDHCGTPPQSAINDPTWSAAMRDIGVHSHVATKLSGVMEAYPTLSNLVQLYDTMDFVLGHFGADRMLAASNFPVNKLTATSSDWANIISTWIKQNNFSDRQAQGIWQTNSEQWYPRIKEILIED